LENEFDILYTYPLEITSVRYRIMYLPPIKVAE